MALNQRVNLLEEGTRLALGILAAIVEHEDPALQSRQHSLQSIIELKYWQPN